MKTFLAVFGMLLLIAAIAAFTGYTVDKTRSHDFQALLRKADTLATQPPGDDPLPYFSMHVDLAAAAGVESCSAAAIRMTQRFLPDGWRFRAADVADVHTGKPVAALHVETRGGSATTWQC